MSANHINNINIHKFKCFDSFKVDSFRRVNLIAGKNNTGKTTLLEACFLSYDLSSTFMNFNDNYSQYEQVNDDNGINETQEFLNFSIIKKLLVIKQNRERGNFLTQWLREEVDLTSLGSIDIAVNQEYKLVSAGSLFTIEQLLNDITVKLKKIFANHIVKYSSNNYHYKIYKKNHPPILNNTNFISVCNDNAIQTMIDDSKLNGKYTQVKSYLKDIFNIENIDVIKNQVMLFQYNSYRNLSEFGDGVRHFLNMVLILLSNENTTIFLDEVDNGIHHSLFDRLWEIILTISKEQNIQVFATTHSQECIESYARVAKKLDDEEITFLELFKHKGKIESMLLSSSMLNLQLDQNHEVRG